MNKNLYNIVKIVAAVIGVIGIIMLVRVVMAGDDVIKSDEAVQTSVVDPFVTFTRIVLILTTILAVVFSIWNLIKNPALLKRALLSLAVLGGLLAIAYFWSNGDAVTDKFGAIIKDGEAGPISRRVGTLIKYTYILGLIGLVCVLWGSFKGLFSNK
ncbi:hypothetical protein [Urechidicola croceus]|uniref:Uncharacterized protein n=1 Tax=Urechidicola croceus TaxID=1850246 RepID=A0A1D8PA80_9FLAO|nr:hypothetical protein [Urechidicola croceus]AOW21451.1 hypothetical protein LPB138_12520 [Urechidicola croceus]